MDKTAMADSLELLKKHEEYLLDQMVKRKDSPHIRNLELHLERIRVKICEKEMQEIHLTRMRNQLAS